MKSNEYITQQPEDLISRSRADHDRLNTTHWTIRKADTLLGYARLLALVEHAKIAKVCMVETASVL